jgi:hypothetical protein
MKRLGFVLMILLLLAACSPTDEDTAEVGQAVTTTLFTDDFNAGTTGWTLTGTAATTTSPRLGASGFSVKLPLRSTVSRGVSTVGYASIAVTVNMAASSLEASPADKCHAEYSTDNGATYTSLLTLANGQDNGVFFSGTYALPAAAENNPVFMIRYRAAGNLASDYCYGETLTVTGTAATFAALPPPTMITSYDPLPGTGAVPRTQLTYTQLITGAAPGAPVDSSAFDVPANAANPTNFFQAPLNSINEATVGSSSVVTDLYSYLSDPERSHLPKLYFEYLSHGTHMIPALRAYQKVSHPFWEFVALPGRVWNENSDNGYSRVALPFTLTQKNSNCVHNGLMTFLFKNGADGQSIAAISSAFYQITQETCEYFKVNLWGTLSVSAATRTVPNAAAIRSAYEAEVAARLPTKDISQLAVDYPGTDVAKFGAGITPAHMTAYGYVIDGVHYRGGYQTRFGTYGYKDVMTFPSYSTAKSYFTSAAAMRLSQKYPALNLYGSSIASRVPSCPAARWGDVTISHALDMATGNYGLVGYEADESSASMTSDYFLVETEAEKLGFMCNKYARKATPGTTWVYHTPDIHLAAVALRQAVLAQEPATGSLANFMVNELYAPLGLSPVTYRPKTTYEDRGTAEQEWGAYGELQSGDDFAKLGAFLNEGEGKIGGVQVLDYTRLKQALQRDPASSGLAVTVPGNPYPHRYKGAFWSADVYGGAYSSCGVTHTPFMSGFGGISVILLKNKSTYYVVSDNDEYLWADAVIEASAHVRSPCAVSYTP